MIVISFTRFLTDLSKYYKSFFSAFKNKQCDDDNDRLIVSRLSVVIRTVLLFSVKMITLAKNGIIA